MTTPEISLASQVLCFFTENAKTDWRKILAEIEEDSNIVDTVIERVNDLLDLHGWRTDPIGIFVGSTVAAKAEFASYGPDAVAEAIRTLKEHDRIVQVGRGRGKAIVVLSVEPLPESEEAPAPQPDPTEAFNADLALLAIRDGIVDLQAKVVSLTRENEELTEQLAASNNRVERLLSQIKAAQTSGSFH